MVQPNNNGLELQQDEKEELVASTQTCSVGPLGVQVMEYSSYKQHFHQLIQ